MSYIEIMSSSETECSPCPYCEGQAQIVHLNGSGDLAFFVRCFVECKRCLSRGPLFGMPIVDMKDKESLIVDCEAKACEAWKYLSINGRPAG